MATTAEQLQQASALNIKKQEAQIARVRESARLLEETIQRLGDASAELERITQEQAKQAREIFARISKLQL